MGAWQKLAAGEYVWDSPSGRYTVSHIVAADEGNGYGRTDHWIVVFPDGEPSMPYTTLGACKALAARDAADRIRVA